MEKTVDLEKILRSKMGSKARWIPRPAVNWLKRIVHEDRINKFLWDARDLKGSPWLKACMEFLDVKLNIVGMENMPDLNNKDKLYTFVSNHPMGGIDGVAIGSVLGPLCNDNFRYLVNDLLMNLPGLAPLCIPINTTTKRSRAFPQIVEAGFKEKTHILLFPAGLCSRRKNGVIEDLEWKKTFVTKSVETHRDVVPIFFGGRNSDFFYRLSNISDRYVKKVNIAMLFLVDEMFKNCGNTFDIHIGKPIPWETFDKSKSPAQWAEYVKRQAYNLQ